jgi:hypothetical protein
MRKLIIIFFIDLLVCSVSAQNTSFSSEAISRNPYSYMDGLFSKRSVLLANNESKREIDFELAKLGVRFPAKVVLSVYESKINVTFPILEDPNASYMKGKLAKLKQEFPELETLNIDGDYCIAAFKISTHERKVEELVNKFFYDGFFVSKHSKVQLTALFN